MDKLGEILICLVILAIPIAIFGGIAYMIFKSVWEDMPKIKESNSQHLGLVKRMIEEYYGVHPRNGTGEVNYDVLDYIPGKNANYPKIVKMRIVRGWFFSKVRLYVDVGGEPEVQKTPAERPKQRETEEHILEITNKDIRKLFPEASANAIAHYKRRKGQVINETKKNLHRAIHNFVNDHVDG